LINEGMLKLAGSMRGHPFYISTPASFYYCSNRDGPPHGAVPFSTTTQQLPKSAPCLHQQQGNGNGEKRETDELAGSGRRTRKLQESNTRREIRNRCFVLELDEDRERLPGTG
jgi:hypothetical protein